MNAFASRLIHAYRDEFGVHGAPGHALERARQAVTALFRRVSAGLRRNVTLEQGVWLLIAALILAFFLVLFLGEVGHGGYGRF